MGSDDESLDGEQKQKKHRKHSSKHKHKHKHKSKKEHKEKREKRKKRRRQSSSTSSSDSEPPAKRGRTAISQPDRSLSSSPGIGPLPPPPPPLQLSLPPVEPPARAFSSQSRPVLSQPKAAGGLAAYLRCAVCRVDSSGEAAFLQHLCGKAHRKTNHGCPGFAGLAPNAMGKIPQLVNPALRSAAVRLGHDPDGTLGGAGTTLTEAQPPAWTPPCRTVEVNKTVEGELHRALQLSSALNTPAVTTEPPRDDLLSRMMGANRPLGSKAPAAAPASSAPHLLPQEPRSQVRRKPPPPPAVVRHGGPFAAVRSNLPVAASREALLSALSEPACIVEGETGSGKTTQVPQYLLEQAAERGESISVICTQPRRISAIGVADRVAAERGERVGVGAVGYAVRGESRQCDETSLLFCTTGVRDSLLPLLHMSSSTSSVWPP